ncbi:MAG TPA: hypothetical protein VLD65_09880 [Anaerolineales bacterium]|nr:hypothetical protein [Anaerolineales bacterium]
MRVIRASEIGTYQYCNRAWWYQLQGYEPDNQLALAKGKEFHEKHNYVVTSASCLQTIAYGMVLIAILTALIWLIQTWL